MINIKTKTKKIYVFKAAIIIVGILLSTLVSAETIIPKNGAFEIEKTGQELSNKQYFIFGVGMCPGIDITGKSQKLSIYEFGHIIGDMYIQNNQDFGPYNLSSNYILYVKFYICT